MESFRKVIRGWLGKVLLVLFLLPLALVGIDGYFGGDSKNTVKTVNGQEISEKELETLTKSLQEQYLSYTQGDETLLNQEFIKNKALDTLVSRNLLLQQAKELGIALSDAQLEQMVAQQPSFQQDGKFSKSLYANYLQSVGMTSEALITGLRQDHALKMISATFLDYALVSKVDIQQIAQLQTEQRSLHLASVKLDDYKKNIKATDAELKAYYDKHAAQFKQVASVDVDYIELSPEIVATQVAAPSAVELQQAYQAFVETQKKNAPIHVKHILVTASERSDVEAKKRADEVVAKIKAGTSFADAAKHYSEDTESKNQGGLIADYSKGVFDASFDQAVDALQAGQVSAPVKTQYGYHVIVKQANTLQVPSFEAEKARLIAEVIKDKKANIFSDTVNSLNDLVVNSDALDVVSQEVKGAKVISQRHVTVSNKLPVLSESTVKAKLFNDDVKNGDRNASSSIQLANGNTVWVKVRNYHAAGVQSFAEVKALVNAAYVEQKAFDTAKAKIQQTLTDFTKQPAAIVVTQSGLNFVPVGTFVRSQGLKREVERTAFSLTAPKAGHWSVGTVKLPNELVVVAISAVNNSPANTLDAAHVEELTKLYQQLRGQQELDDYTRYLKQKAKIK